MNRKNQRNESRQSKRRQLPVALLFMGLLCGCLPFRAGRAQSMAPGIGAGSETHAGTTLSPNDLAGILPPSVFFRGKVAPVQTRNSGATRWPDGSLLWAAMVDNSGYASDIQDTYQFYLVSEQPVMIGGQALPPGAYGAGLVAGKLTVQDIGGHVLLSVPAETDAAMQRPRPLQVVAAGPETIRLYLGRHWVLVQLAHHK